MTSAPRSARVWLAHGPARTRERSSTRIPSSGQLIVTPLSIEALQTRLCPPEDERMHVVGAFVGIHRLEIHHVAHHLEPLRDAVAAVHVPRHARDVEGLTAVVA